MVAAASISTYLVRAGYVVTVQSSGRSVDRLVAEGQDTLEDAMVDLAVLEPEPHDHPAPVDAERVTFVVLGRTSVARAQHWATTVASARTTWAFVARGTPSDALDLLDAAGWKVVPYAPGDDLAEPVDAVRRSIEPCCELTAPHAGHRRAAQPRRGSSTP